MTFLVRPVQCSPDVVSALSAQLEQLTNAEVLGNVNSLAEDVILHNGTPPSLFCVAMRVSDPSWITLIRTLRRAWSTVPILVLVPDRFDTTTLVEAMAAGASDVHLLSSDTADRLDACVRSLLPGAPPFPLAQGLWGPRMSDVLWKPQMEAGEGLEMLEDSGSRVLFLQIPASTPNGPPGFVALAFQRGSPTPMRVLALDHSSSGTSCLLEKTGDGLCNCGSVTPQTAFPEFRAWALWTLRRSPDIQSRKGFTLRGAALNGAIDSRLLIPITSDTAHHLQLLRRLGEGSVLKLAITPDGRLAAVWSVAGLSVIEVATANRLAHLPLARDVTSIDISEDGNNVALAIDGPDILLWRVRTASYLQRLPTGPSMSRTNVVKFTDHGRAILAVGWVSFADQSQMADPIPYRGVVIDLATGSTRGSWTLKQSPVDVAVSPDGNHMVLVFDFGQCELWSLPGKKIRDLGVQGMDLQFFSPDSRLLSLHNGPSWAITRTETGEVIQTGDERDVDDHKPGWLKAAEARWSSEVGLRTSLRPFTPTITSLAFSRDSRHLYVGAGGQAIRVWDTTSGTQGHTIILGQDPHASNVKSLASSPSGDLLAVGQEQGPVPILSVPTGEIIHQLDPHSGSFWRSKICVAFSPDGATVVTAGSDGKVRLWATRDWRRVWEQDLGPEPGSSREQKKVHEVCFSGDGRFVGVSHSGGLMTVLHAASGSVAFDLSFAAVELDEKESAWLPRSSTDRETYCGAISNDGRLAYTNVFSGVYRYDLSATGTPGRRVSEVSGPREPARWAMSADERVWFLGADFGGTVKAVDLKGVLPPIDLACHTGRVLTTAISPDGKLLASGGEDGTVCLWGISTFLEDSLPGNPMSLGTIRD